MLLKWVYNLSLIEKKILDEDQCKEVKKIYMHSCSKNERNTYQNSIYCSLVTRSAEVKTHSPPIFKVAGIV